MKMKDVRSLATQMGLKPGRLTKVALIRTLQKHEGNFECFATPTDGHCDQLLCAWRDDCLSPSRR